jgi:hypothetical protein
MASTNRRDRRHFLGTSLAAMGAAGAIAGSGAARPAAASPQEAAASNPPEPGPKGMPYGMLGKAKISRLLLGGNLVSGCMHSRDLTYVGRLFRAYVTEEKIMETFKLAEQQGINAVLESGANLVRKYNQDFGGHMQIIPSVHPAVGQDEAKLKAEIQGAVEAGVPALYVWGVAGDTLVRAGEIDLIARAVEYIKAAGVPAGVGGHSLEVPKACEKHQVPCDFYVKTLHSSDYPSAVPPDLRKDYGWLEGGPGWYDNMWCINPEETIEFMQSVAKPWIAFKILAAGGIHPRQGFAHAFRGGADFVGVGMFDFQIEENAELVRRLVEREKDRPRPWRA